MKLIEPISPRTQFFNFDGKFRAYSSFTSVGFRNMITGLNLEFAGAGHAAIEYLVGMAISDWGSEESAQVRRFDLSIHGISKQVSLIWGITRTPKQKQRLLRGIEDKATFVFVACMPHEEEEILRHVFKEEVPVVRWTEAYLTN